jgi:hypothetical protein
VRHDLVLGAPLELIGRSEQRKALTYLARSRLKEAFTARNLSLFQLFPRWGIPCQRRYHRLSLTSG